MLDPYKAASGEFSYKQTKSFKNNSNLRQIKHIGDSMFLQIKTKNI